MRGPWLDAEPPQRRQLLVPAELPFRNERGKYPGLPRRTRSTDPCGFPPSAARASGHCPTGECEPASVWVKVSRLHRLIRPLRRSTGIARPLSGSSAASSMSGAFSLFRHGILSASNFTRI